MSFASSQSRFESAINYDNSIGAEVEVMPDSKPKVAITNSNIQGTWAKVKYGTNTGYMFDGYLSRYHANSSRSNLLSYLKLLYKVKLDVKNPVSEFQSEWRIEFTNGVVYTAGVTSSDRGEEIIDAEGAVFPTAVITFQELYLISRLTYQFSLIGKECPIDPVSWKKEYWGCSLSVHEPIVKLRLKRLPNNNYSMQFGDFN